MAAIDRRLSKARTDVCEWNVDRDWGFRGTKGYGISRNYYHRTARRFSKKLCTQPSRFNQAMRSWVEVNPT